MQKSAKIQVITFFLAAGSSPGCVTETPVLTDQMGALLILGVPLVFHRQQRVMFLPRVCPGTCS